MPSSEQIVRFRSGDIELDGRIAVPGGAARACVVCHPHPLYGGDMHSAVVVAVTSELLTRGIATLRFDFRGAGSSGGSHGGGAAEVEDARAAVGELARRSGLERVAVAGYSFGAWIALRLAACDERILAVAAIAPPLEMLDLAFAHDLEVPVLAVAGERDTYCPRPAFGAFEAGLKRATIVTLDGADHFLAGREREVAGAVAAFVAAA